MTDLAALQVQWLSPSDLTDKQAHSIPGFPIDRLRENFRIAVCRTPKDLAPIGWLAGILQQGGVVLLDPPGGPSVKPTGETTAIAVDIAQALLEFSVREFSSQQFGHTQMIQLMLPEGQPSTETAALASGFCFGANLLLMGGDCQSDAEPILPPGMHFSPSGPELGEVIEKTYVETLDCPMLCGTRPMPEVVASYAATGQSGTKFWTTLFEGSKAVGCVLVAAHPHLEIAELVYMGLEVSARKRHLGKELLLQAELKTREAGFQRMVIGVDAANTPARRLYEWAGYATWERRRVFLWFAEESRSITSP